MVYGVIFLEYAKASAQSQREGIQRFAEKRGLAIDELVSYTDNPRVIRFRTGDTIICYAWNCIYNSKFFFDTFIPYILRNRIYLFSVTSKYSIDESTDYDMFARAFAIYQDAQFDFLSYKNAKGATKRAINGNPPGRHPGSKNLKHVIDGKEKIVRDMFAGGTSIYAIAKKTHMSAPTIKRFLVSQN